MKIGFSFGKCIRDIAAGTVDIKDVVVIVARTDVDREHLGDLVVGYQKQRGLYRDLDLDHCKAIAEQLWDEGKIHQPRKFDVYPGLVVPDHFVWMDLAPTVNSDNPAVMAAWKNYQMIAKLAEGKIPDRTEAERVVLTVDPKGF